MFYISRKIGTNKYGVVDTEDGREDIFTLNELKEMCCGMRIPIEGVTTFVSNYRTGNLNIGGVSVYQPAETSSVRQTKLNALFGVQIKTMDDTVVSIVIRDARQSSERPVRLSDYGSKCAKYLFHDNCRSLSGTRLTLVLDDNIWICGKAFKDFVECDVVIDLREVSNDKQAELVYRDMLHSYGVSAATLHQHIIDKPERMDFWRAVYVMSHGFTALEKFTHVRDVLVIDPIGTQCKVIKRFKSDFLAIADCNFALNSRGKWSYLLEHYINWLKDAKNSELMSHPTFRALKSADLSTMVKVMANETTCNANIVNRFYGCVQYFDTTPEIEAAWVKFVTRANLFLVEAYKNRGESPRAFR